MDTQPAARPDEAATPMTRTPSKRNQTIRAVPSPASRRQAETARKRSLRKQRSLLHD